MLDMPNIAGQSAIYTPACRRRPGCHSERSKQSSGEAKIAFYPATEQAIDKNYLLAG